MSQYLWRLADWGIKAPPEVDKRLRVYAEELIKFNRRINLVSPKSLAMADAVHFADSLLAGNSVMKKVNNNKVITDIGSGNGFPGLALAAMYQDRGFELFDIDERKVEFLKHVISKMQIGNCKAFVRDANRLATSSLEAVVMRGFASIPSAMKMLAPALQADAQALFLKSENWSKELQIGGALADWRTEVVGEYEQPVTRAKMVVVGVTSQKS